MTSTQATTSDILHQLVCAVSSGQPHQEAIAQLQARADWDTFATPKARHLQVQAWCAAIKPTLPKALYQQTKRALRAAALPDAALPELVQFKHAGVRLELNADAVLERGGILANYIGPFRESSFGTHTLRLGFHLTPEQLMGIANYVDTGALPPHLSVQLRKQLGDFGDRLGMDGLKEAAGAGIDERASARQTDLRRNTLIDLGIQITTGVDATWEQTKKHVALPSPQVLETVWPLEAWSKPYSKKAVMGLRNTFATPQTRVQIAAEVDLLPVQLGWLHKLQELDLRWNIATSWPESLAGLTSLKSIDLDSSQIETLPTWIFELPHLTRLHARHVLNVKGVASFDPRRSNLTNVQLGGFAQGALPNAFFALPALTSLAIESGTPSDPHALSQASHLQSFNWEADHIPLTEAMGALTSLRVLILRDRQGMQNLPAAVGRLTALQSVDIQLSSLPMLTPEIGTWVNLTSLVLSHNSLTALPDTLYRLTHLARLSIDHNQLGALSPQVGNLNQLTALNLMNNHLVDLPREMAALTNLQTLYLNANRLTAFPQGLIALPQLRHLELEANQLASMPTHLSLPHLTTLGLSNNQIRELDLSGRWVLPSIDDLLLDYNLLRRIPNTLTQLTALHTLSLFADRVPSVPREVWRMPNLFIRPR